MRVQRVEVSDAIDAEHHRLAVDHELLESILQRRLDNSRIAIGPVIAAAGELMLTIMAGIAQFERSLILARTEVGIARARAQGNRFGRPAALDAGQKRKIAERCNKGETMAELAADYGVSEPTIWRALQ
jgi:DNA invertase Pin-like site-specific DNA recombinase